jgi:hypothetical protein
MDEPLLHRLVCSAVDYIEKMANICMVDKEVKVSFVGPFDIYPLKFKVREITSVKVNGVEIENFTLYNNQPAYLVLTDMINNLDVVDIEYTADGKHDNYNANELAIAYASALYNNPEGIGELDMRRINNRITSIAG